jgi:branched-chain amino acid transport system permease protein
MTPRRRAVSLLAALGALAAIPLVAALVNEPFYLDLFRRIMIFAIAAVSLDIILGYGGMVSLGHAAYLGIGAYAVAIPALHGIHSAWVQWPLAIVLSGLAGLVIGAISLRTSGVYFIMITLAFAQMIYYVAVSLNRYGADDGLTIYKRSQFAGLNIANKVVFYYLCLALLLLVVVIVWRLVNSRFGMVIRGAKSNDRRMRAIGFPTFRYRLIAFTIAGVICGLSGALLANQAEFISPAAMHWTRSGDLIIMVVLGGMGSLFGPVIGAVAFLLLEEVLSRITEYWQLIFGPLLLAIVLYARGGIDGLLAGPHRD